MSIKRLPLSPLVVLLSAGPLNAAVVFTGDCDETMSSTERRILTKAFSFVSRHKFDVFDEIESDRSGPNEHLYRFIDSDLASAWRRQVEEMADGRMKIACHHNGDGTRCDDEANLSGWTIDDPDGLDIFDSDRVNICIDNIQAMGTTESADIALVANTLAHEMTHHVDGNEGHGEGHFSEPEQPDGAAVTIGVAIEHLAASPALSAKLEGDEAADFVTIDAAGLTLNVRGVVHNGNALAGAWLPSSMDRRNGVSQVCLLKDGHLVDDSATPRLVGLSDAAFSFRMPLTYAQLTRNTTFEVQADCQEEWVEIDEADNRVEVPYDFSPDLKLNVEVDGPPQRVLVSSRPAVVYANRTTWRITVTNPDRTPSLPSRLRIFKGIGIGQEALVALPALARGDQFQTLYTANVPESLQTPVGFTFQAGDADLLAVDERPSDNRVELVLDTQAWLPDLRPVFVSQGMGETLSRVQVKAENFGYHAAGSSRINVFNSEGVLVATRLVGPLAVRASQMVELDLPHPSCRPARYRFEVDTQDAVRESNEANNGLNMEVGMPCLAIDVGDPLPEIDPVDL